MLSKLLVLLLFGFAQSASVSTLLIQKLKPEHRADPVDLVPARQIAWNRNEFLRSEDFDCPREGFYVHRSNSSRFYRCVKYEKNPEVFTLYLFECPRGQVFIERVDTCARETVDGSDYPEVDGSSPSESDPGDGSGGEAASDPYDVVGAVQPVGESSQPESDSADVSESGVGDEGSATEPQSVAEAQGDNEDELQSSGSEGDSAAGDSSSGGESAPQKLCVTDPNILYEQYSKYCNIFHLCNNSTVLFACQEGSAFTEESQMCRLITSDNEMCTGKQIYPHTILRFAYPFGIVQQIPLVPNAEPFGLDAATIFGLQDGNLENTKFKNDLGVFKDTAQNPQEHQNLSPELFLQELLYPHANPQSHPVVYDVPQTYYHAPYQVRYVSPNYQPYRQSFDPYNNFFGSFYTPLRNKNYPDESIEQFDGFRKAKSKGISYN